MSSTDKYVREKKNRKGTVGHKILYVCVCVCKDGRRRGREKQERKEA